MTLREQRAADILREHGYKLTRPRRAVIHVLANAAEPLTINDLHERAQASDAELGLVTVYRTLEILLELNMARAVHLDHSTHGYCLATPGHTHHLICRQCNAVVEIEGCDLTAFLERIAQQTGYTITGHLLELEGICAACQQDNTAGH